ncbi:MAG: rhomboid family intramembrane serine protease [Thermodesulfobacteriota bacterium]
MSDHQEKYVPAGTTGNRYQARIWSLVLHSAGIPHLTREEGADYLIMAPEDQLARAEKEIGRFEEENYNWPPPKFLGPLADEAIDHHPPTILLMGGLLVFHGITGPFVEHSNWFMAGAVDSKAILAGGEWWRLITALTLHADSVHLLGNLLIGGMVIHFLSRLLGTGLSWFLLVMSGVLGNLINVIARGPDHISVGFSTAVFAAVGILCGCNLRSLTLRGVLLPLGAGAGLLAMLGTSGERTDLGAHLWGLLVGLACGFAWSWLKDSRWIRFFSARQLYLLACTLGLVIVSWLKALHS